MRNIHNNNKEDDDVKKNKKKKLMIPRGEREEGIMEMEQADPSSVARVKS